MNQDAVVLLALAAANDALHTPAQVQKLLFLIDRNLSEDLEGPHFHFELNKSGPFDQAVDDTLEKLARENLVKLVIPPSSKEYALTEQGKEKGEQLLKRLSPQTINYIKDASTFVRELRFS